jgi:glycosyltransferase involved in cell wall biosynthesis
MPRISVLMPVYNTNPDHLKQAMDSVLAQTFSDFEFLIVNDASTDDRVAEIVRSYDDKRIRYIENERNMGISAVRNMMVDMAQGEYLAVMDHDDICAPTRFEKQITFMDAHPDHVLCGTAYKRFGSWLKAKTIRYPQHHDTIKATLFFKCVVHHPSAFIRKSVMVDHGTRYDETLVSSNDRKLYLDLSMHGKLHNLQEVLCFYRLHNQMTSKTKRQIIIQDQKRLRAEFLQKMGAHLSDDEKHILDQFVTRGRTRIKNKDSLRAIQTVLEKLVQANNQSEFFPSHSFSIICASYFTKRCLNAAIYGRVSSGRALENTTLPVQSVKIPVILKIFNSFV